MSTPTASTGTERETQRTNIVMNIGIAREAIRQAKATLWEQARQVEGDLIKRENMLKAHGIDPNTDEMALALNTEANDLSGNAMALSQALDALDRYRGQM